MRKVSGNITKYSHGKYRVYLYLGLYDSEFEAMEIVERMKTNVENGQLLVGIEPEKYTFKWYQHQETLKRSRSITN